MRIARVVPLALVLAAAGCAKAPPVPEDNFYRLPEVTARERSGSPIDGLILVRALETDALHSERAILYAEDEKALSLKRYHYHLWLNRPPRLIQEYLVEHLRAAKLASMVVTDIATPADFVVTGKIKRFERHLQGSGSRALVVLELRLDRRGDRRPLLLRDYRAAVPAEGGSMAATVAAFAKGLDQTIGRFLSDVEAALALKSSTASPRAAR